MLIGRSVFFRAMVSMGQKACLNATKQERRGEPFWTIPRLPDLTRPSITMAVRASGSFTTMEPNPTNTGGSPASRNSSKSAGGSYPVSGFDRNQNPLLELVLGLVLGRNQDPLLECNWNQKPLRSIQDG